VDKIIAEIASQRIPGLASGEEEGLISQPDRIFSGKRALSERNIRSKYNNESSIQF
jgi:hypothetical protein